MPLNTETVTKVDHKMVECMMLMGSKETFIVKTVVMLHNMTKGSPKTDTKLLLSAYVSMPAHGNFSTQDDAYVARNELKHIEICCR